MTPRHPCRSLVIASLSLAFVALACIARGQSAQLKYATDVADCGSGRVLVGLANGPMALVTGPAITYPTATEGYAKAVACNANTVAAITAEQNGDIVWVRDTVETRRKISGESSTITLTDIAVGDSTLAVTGVVAGNPARPKVWFFDLATGEQVSSKTSGIAGDIAFDRGAYFWADTGRAASDWKPAVATVGNPAGISVRNLVLVAGGRGTSPTTINDGVESKTAPTACRMVSAVGYEFACVQGTTLSVWRESTRVASITLPSTPQGVTYDGLRVLVALYSSGVAIYRLDGATLMPSGFLPVAASPVPTVAATRTATTNATTPTPALDCSGCTLSGGNLRCGACR